MIESWEKVLDPNFINAELLGPVGSERTVTIKDIDLAECFDASNGKKTVKALFFNECKPMVLNKTNIKTLISIFGSEDPAQCVGQQITLYVANVKGFGRTTTGIRIREFSATKCEMCGKFVKPGAGRTVAQLIEYSKAHFDGKTICIECMNKVAKNKKEENKNA